MNGLCSVNMCNHVRIAVLVATAAVYRRLFPCRIVLSKVLLQTRIVGGGGAVKESILGYLGSPL